MNDKLTAIGKYNEDFNNYLPYNIKSSNIFQSSGLEKHIIKRHPDCLKYIGFIPQIIANPDYIGINPNEKVTSFELVKCISENVQIGIKLDAKDNYLYVATLHTITDSKVFQIFQIIHRLLFLYPKRTTLWLQQKKLPSGNWRCQVYSHTEETMQPDGTITKKRIYHSDHAGRYPESNHHRGTKPFT